MLAHIHLLDSLEIDAEMKCRAMLHDENMYPDSFSFKPERFIGSNGKLNPAVKDPETVIFGFGRR